MTSVCKVLLVDDSPEDRFLYQNFLESGDISVEVVVAETGEAALIQYSQAAPDVILLDYRLPDLNGLEVLMRLRQLGGPQAFLPAIILTGQGSERTAVQAMQAGAQDYLLKDSLTASALCRAVKNVWIQAKAAQQLQRQREYRELIARAALRVRRAVSLAAVLETSVAEVRQLLQSDRVVIYQFAEDMSGHIVAESVLSPFQPCLGEHIIDTCFQSLDAVVEAYRRGKLTAIEDVGQAALTPCHRQLLARLQVQALLVVPIVITSDSCQHAAATDDCLWGLLIAHQCSGPRPWEVTELEWLDELATQISLAIQQAELQRHLQRLNQALEAKVEARTAELAASERRFRAIFDNTFQFTGLLTREGRLLEANQTALEFAGISLESVLHRPFWETHWWQASEAVQAQLKAAIARAAQGDFVRYEVEVLNADNTPVAIDFSLRPLRDEHGNVILLIPEGRDISDRKQAEAERRASEERLRVALEAAQIGSWDWDLRTNRIQWSASMQRLTGCQQEHPSGSFEAMTADIHADDRDRVRAEMKHCAERGVAYQSEFRFIKADGGVRRAFSRGNVICDEAGRPIRMVGVDVDITNRKQIEAALQQSEATNRNILRAMPDLLFRVTATGELIESFPGCAPLQPGQSQSASTHVTQIPAELKAARRAATRQALSTRTIQIYTQQIDINQEIRWEEVRIVPCEHNEALVLVRDITERTQAEAALRQKELQLRLVIEATQDGFWDWNLQTNAGYWSPRVYEMLGLPVATAEPAIDEAFFSRVHPEDLPRVYRALQDHLTQGKPYNIEIRLRRSDDRDIWVWCRGEALRNSAGEFYRMTGGISDITERKHLEQKLKYWNHQLELRVESRTAELAEINQQLRSEVEQRRQTEAALRDSEVTKQALIEAIPDLLIHMDRDGNYLAVFKSGNVKLVNPERTATGNNIYNVLPRAFATARLRHAQEALASQRPVTHEYRLEVDGAVIYEEARIAPCTSNTVLIIVRDITARRVAEETVGRNEARFQRIANNVPGALYQFRQYPDGRREFPYISDRIADIAGISAEDIQAGRRSLFEQIHLEDQETLEASIALSAETLCRWHWEGRILTSVRDVVWLQSISEPEPQPDGSILWDGLLIDITARKQAEEDLQASEASYRRIVETAHEGIWIIDEQARTTYCNPQMAAMLGYSVAEMLGHSMLDFMAPDVRGLAIEYLARLREGITESHDFCFQRKDGGDLWTMIAATPILDEVGGYQGALGMVTDITARKRAEAEIIRNRDLREAIFNNVTDAIFLVDPKTWLTLDCNQGAVTIFEADNRQQLIGIKGEDLQKYTFSEAEEQAIAAAMTAQGVWSCEVEYVSLKGRLFWGSLVAKSITVAGKTMNLVRVTDITERKQIEEEMRRSLAREKELSELKSRFISMTSHEFRTPLSVIGSSAGILENFGHRLSEEKKQGHLQTIKTYVRHTTRLLDDILLLNRAEAGNLAFNPAPMDVAQFCCTLTEEMQLSTEQLTLDYRCQTWAGDRLDSAQAYLDQKLLRQILSNLLSNAIKYSPESDRVAFTVLLSAETVTFRVQDWGMGIPAADQPKLFESFHRAENVETIQGTGLGLVIVKKCAELHGGQVTFESTVGIGTTFTVTLPRYIN